MFINLAQDEQVKKFTSMEQGSFWKGARKKLCAYASGALGQVLSLQEISLPS
jgi:hypothetical protein